MSRLITTLIVFGSLALLVAPAAAELTVHPRKRTETSPGSGRYHATTSTAAWQAPETAIIVCDMWDSHHCLNAVRRVGELVPRMNQVLETARKQGTLIIHAPSSCMEAYADHPARANAKLAPTAANLPSDIGQWCRHIPAEDAGQYPVDQKDGGEDDEPAEHAAWAALLESKGLNPRAPWKRQVDGLRIDPKFDIISDSGVEIWNTLEQRGIKNVVLLGVHTNMCVLGRPFGLRQMAKNGKNVVLMRDMTDTMYDPSKWPYVSHFSGTDRIVEHIEKFVCPTITSVDILGGKEFRFSRDRRPHLVLLVAEDEYKTEVSLPPYVTRHLERDFRVTTVFGNDVERNDLPGIDAVANADLLLVSVRRRTIPVKQLEYVRKHVAAGKPLLGIRTANHAFAPSKGKQPGEGQDAWNNWDPEVFGGSYRGHHPEGPKPKLAVADQASSHPILAHVDFKDWLGHGSLYQVNPLLPGTVPLISGTIGGQPTETIAWVRIRADGGRSFYTSLGHVDDFQTASFRRLLFNAIYWSAGLPIPEHMADSPEKFVAGK
ncbi:MAG: isochorismatase family protein [Planctomycetaceae bacterium]|nr:isochorismatase family protein [Planctomycetaceae bacterium]